MRFLIVEDDYTNRKLLTNILKKHADCDTAENGEECVEIFRNALTEGRPYNLVCMDIMMPKMDGQQALKEIRKVEKAFGVVSADEVTVVMVTALDDPKTVVKAYYEGGAAAYLTKPIEIEGVLEVLRELQLIH